MTAVKPAALRVAGATARKSALQNGAAAHDDAFALSTESSSLSRERLRVGASAFYVVEGQLVLLGMLHAYRQLRELAADLAPEIAHRAVEILKVQTWAALKK